MKLRFMISKTALAATVAFEILATGAAIAAADTEPYSKWFKYAPEISRQWEINGDSAKPLQVLVKNNLKQGPLRRVFVLYPRASSAYDIAITQILQVFSNKEINAEVLIVNFELDDTRGKALMHEAEKGGYELVFAMGSESAAWLYNHYKNGALPVVTVCSKDPVLLGQMKDYDSGSGSNFAFTSLNVPIEVQMAYVRDLRPGLKNITILVDSKNISAMQTQAEPIAMYAKEKNIQIIWGSVNNPEKAREELEQIVPQAVAKMRLNDPGLSESLFWITGSTSVFREIKTINRFSDRVPVVSAVPEIVKAGPDTAALGVGVSFESNGRLAGIYGARVLAGTKVGALKVGLVSPPDMAISFLKAREIGLRVPFSIFEIASFIYDYNGNAVRSVKSEAEATN
jgi:putative tryptophan/tyrosine transport system substrate-binding protein